MLKVYAVARWQDLGVAVPNYVEAKVPAYTLPSPLLCNDGTPIRDVAAWRTRRRPELLEIFGREIYGRTPGNRPSAMHWETTAVDRHALGGAATRKEVTVWFTAGVGGPQMHLLVYQPNGPGGPWPVFLGMNFYGNMSVNADAGIAMSCAWMRDVPAAHIVGHRATDATRGCQASQWPVELMVARGYAVATFYYGDVCPDHPVGLEQSVGALFHTGGVDTRAPDSWGSIGIWAWGLSRALDWIETDRELDAKRVAVFGHSRLGKAALWAAAQDERFALVISNESGSGGATLAKRAFGATVALNNIHSDVRAWFCRNYRRYSGNEAALPVDQHELLALIAPRPLYVASAVLDVWEDPRGEFLSLKNAEPVYRLWGRTGLGESDMPAANAPVIGDGLAYHIRSGGHDINAYDWAQYLNFADLHLKRAERDCGRAPNRSD